jgi:hypothetical protein
MNVTDASNSSSEVKKGCSVMPSNTESLAKSNKINNQPVSSVPEQNGS